MHLITDSKQPVTPNDTVWQDSPRASTRSRQEAATEGEAMPQNFRK